MPSVKKVTKAVIKEDSIFVLRCFSFSTIQRHTDAIALDVDKPRVSELRGCKFAIQLDQSTFGTNNVLMAYAAFRSASIKCLLIRSSFQNI